MAETEAQAIERMRALLQSGVTSDSQDGASTSFDHDTIRAELARMEARAGYRRKKTRVITPRMDRR